MSQDTGEFSDNDYDLSFDDDSDLDDEFDPAIRAETAASLTVGPGSVKYRMHSLGQIDASLQSLIKRASGITGDEDDVSILLLNAFDWDLNELVSTYLERPAVALEKVGISENKRAANVKTKKPSKQAKIFECPVCTEETNLVYSLGCGHAICRVCFQKHIQLNMIESRNLFGLRCPGDAKCSRLVSRKDVAELLPQKLVTYNEMVTKAYVANQPFRFQHCPAPDCEYIAVGIDEKNRERIGGVNCLCGATFCFECGLPCHHYAVPCDLAGYWLAMADKEARSAQWITENTKKCPNCHSTIERDEGCNHMRCGQCKHEFCWKCRRDWAEHKGGSYYECNLKSVSQEKIFTKTLSRKQYERLSKCMNGFDTHSVLASRSNFEQDKHLRDAHNLLAWTYALLYITVDSNSKIILEELAESLGREIGASSAYLQQRYKALADFVTDENIKWVVDPKLRLRLDKSSEDAPQS